jgi:opacity protein-like surface antigen
MNLNDPPGTSLSSKLTYGITARLGYSLASAFGAATTGTAAPTLPSQFLASMMTPYINAGEVKRHGQAALRSGAGVEALLATNWTLNADYFHYSYNQGGSAGTLAGAPVSLTSDNEFRLSINRHFGL